MRDNVRREQIADSGDAREQRRGRCIHIDSDGVDAIFHNGVESARQFQFRNIMLILTNPDRLWIDLDEFRRGVLQSARDRHGAAQRHVEIGQFARCIFGSGINRGARFRHDDFRQLQFGIFGHQSAGQLVGLARGGAIADGDQLDLMLARQLAENHERFIPARLRLMRIDRRRRHDLAGAVDHGNLHAGAKARIETERRARAGGRRRAADRADFRRRRGSLHPPQSERDACARRRKDAARSWCARPSAWSRQASGRRAGRDLRS